MTEINYSKLRSLTAREIVSSLIKDGFYLDQKSGSHQQYYHQDSRRVTVSFLRSGGTFSFKILKSMLEKQAKWSVEYLKRSRLID